MKAQLWTNEFLDRKRLEGDSLADEVIEDLFQRGQTEEVNKLMMTLVRNDGLPSPELPIEVQDYLERTSRIPLVDPEQIRKGEEIFATYGPEILMILGFYSLPAAYAAKKGVQVLFRTGYLLKRPTRRVFETTQMVIDVMAQGGLEAGGRGVRTAEKVRLMHSAIRHLTKTDPDLPWDDQELGVPINQEDLAATLMTFSYLVIEGLERMEIRLRPEEQEAYLHAWQAVGRIMGVHEELIPDNVSEAKLLTQTIRKRQIAASNEGKAMTQALVEGMETLMPRAVSGIVPSMIHFFLDSDPFLKQNIAEMLNVPPADWTKLLVEAIRDFSGFLNWIAEHSNVASSLMRFVSRHFVESLMDVERGGTRASFHIPDHLKDLWSIG